MFRIPSKLAASIALSCFVFVGTAEIRGALVDDFSSGYAEGDISGQTGGVGWEAGSSWIALGNPGDPGLGHAFNVDEVDGDWRLQVFSISGHDQMEQSAVSRPYVRAQEGPYSLLFEIELVDFDAQPGTWISLMDQNDSFAVLGAGSPTWIVLARSPLTNEDGDQVWAVHDGIGNGQWQGATLTDVVLEPGGVYQFEIELLGGNQYRVHIDNGSELYSSEPLGFRANTSDGWPHEIPHFSMRSAARDNATAFNVNYIRTFSEPSFPLLADFGTVRFIEFLPGITTASPEIAVLAEGEPFYVDTDDIVESLPSGLSGKLAIRTQNDGMTRSPAQVFDGEREYIRLEGTQNEYQHFLHGEGKASFTVKYDTILATGDAATDRSFFLSAEGDIRGGAVDLNVGVSQFGDWWLNMSDGTGGYRILEIDIEPGPEVGQWYDVVVDFNEGTFSVDGEVLRTFDQQNSDGGAWTHDFHFGFTPGHPTRHFHGEMTEVKFEDGDGNLTGHWKLDEAEGFTVLDLSGAENHGTLSMPNRPLEDLASYIGFVVDRETVVYVAYDQEGTVPAWLANRYSQTGMTVETSAGGFDLWERQLAAGEEVVMPFDNSAWEDGDNKFWIILDQDESAITPSMDEGLLRSAAQSADWRLTRHNWRLTTKAQSEPHMASMLATFDGFDLENSFRMISEFRVPRLQDAGENAVGMVMLGGGEDMVRGEWLPRAPDGGSYLQLVDTAEEEPLDVEAWLGTTPGVVNNDVGLLDRTNEVVFSRGVMPFTDEGASLEEDFSDGGANWTSGTETATADPWEFGVPTTGPGGAYTGDNVAATRLDGGYDGNTEAWLRSPVVDLTTTSGSELRFREYLDLDTFEEDGELFHFVTISVLEADSLDLIEEVARYSETILSWRERVIDLSAFDGQEIILEFKFTSDDFMQVGGDGWYLDDISVDDVGGVGTIVGMPERIALDGSLYGLQTENAGVTDESEDYLQFVVSDRAPGEGNEGVAVYVAWDTRASGLEPNWLQESFTRTDDFVELGTLRRHRLWAREYDDGEEVTLGGASALGAGALPHGTNNYFVLFGDARGTQDQAYTFTAEGTREEGAWNLKFSLSDSTGHTQSVEAVIEESPNGQNTFGLFAHHPDSSDGQPEAGPFWEFENLWVTALVDLPDGFAEWRQDAFGEDADDDTIAGPLVDPDGDGIPNLLEYALGGDPLVPDRGILPVERRQQVNGADYLTLEFTRPENRPDLSYVVESSHDLADNNGWSADSVEFLGEGDAGTETWGVPIDEEERKFLRLRVERN